ncbi:MAG: hypothetical protein GY896_11780 [Gammaproteobacteria bacterium]|nr:hypothetical protein [Gammaproteobacteria bacterium]
MNKVFKVLLAASLLFASTSGLAGQTLWKSVETEVVARAVDHPAAYFSVDLDGLEQRLQSIPHQVFEDFSNEIELPMSDGGVARFSIVEAPIMQSQLAQKYPQIKTYKVFGIDDPLASGRIDISPRGFFGMLHTTDGRVFIEPQQVLDNASHYVVRRQDSIPRSHDFSCSVHGSDFTGSGVQSERQRVVERVPGMLLEYDLAVSATEEYVAAVGSAGDVTAAQAAIVTAINRVNQIYERDLGITLKLVANNDQLIEKSGNVSFSNNDSFTLLAENQCWIDTVIGDLNYDIGHLFGTGSGGVARLRSVCGSDIKAMGVTGLPDPTGDPFYIDFVAHEIGHQFGAEHSFNGTTNSCNDNRSAGSAVEPGSGSTIMGYANICGGENLQTSSDATFHANTISEIHSFTGTVACDALVATSPANNNDPVITPIANITIPSDTAFVMSGTAADVDGDVPTYQWDQIDVGTATNASTFGMDLGDNALFRTYEPRTSATRHFPALGTQLEGEYDAAEALPCNNRQMNFRLTARDNRSGQDFEDVRIDVTSDGPFEITNFNTPQTIVSNNGAIILQWDNANTDNAPVNCPNVNIDLLTFATGYTTYTVHNLMTSTANDGQQSVNIIPITDSHPRARFRVSCSTSIFYDISDADLTITGANSTPQTFFDEDDITTVFNPVTSTKSTSAPTCGNPRSAGDSSFNQGLLAVHSDDAGLPGSAGAGFANLPASCAAIETGGGTPSSGHRDTGSFDLAWLLLLSLLATARYWLRRQSWQ